VNVGMAPCISRTPQTRISYAPERMRRTSAGRPSPAPPGNAVRRGRLRRGHYRLAIIDKAGTIEPDAIDVGQEGETFAIRWTPK